MQRTYDGAVYLHGNRPKCKNTDRCQRICNNKRIRQQRTSADGRYRRKGNKVTYTYDTKNDLLTGATASDGTNTVKLGYTYDEGDRLKTIAHNGFEYTYEYDFLGNQTRILAGGNALEEYDYLPSDGPLSEVKYATGEVLKNSYDKYEQIVEQKWNGTTVFRNIYDDYGNVFYHEDLENDRKIFFDYDMIQRMAGYRTTDGETEFWSYQK